MASLQHVMFDTRVGVHKLGRQTMTVAGQSAFVVRPIDHQHWHARRGGAWHVGRTVIADEIKWHRQGG